MNNAMKCTDVTELLADYWDLPEHDLRRMAVDEHVKRCKACAEEFELWRESMELIKEAAEPAMIHAPVERPALSASVMDRIYAEESWRMPIQERVLRIPAKLRLRLTAVIAFSLSLFMFSFIYSLTFQEPVDDYSIFSADKSGLMPVANALGEAKAASVGQGLKSVPVASLSDPFVLKMGSVTYYPNYLLACSFLGLIGALLILNWFIRTRN